MTLKHLICVGAYSGGDYSGEVRRLIKNSKGNNYKFTVAKNWISAVSYLSVGSFAALWLDWSLVKKNIRLFHKELHNLSPQTPIILIHQESIIPASLWRFHRHYFALVHKTKLAQKSQQIQENLIVYSQLLNEVPNRVKKKIRPNGLGPFVGNSLPMLDLYRKIAKVATTEFTVLITGESGTGKELVAKTIHELGPRKNKRFISINCAAIPDNLLESELFGYERGAFTDAVQSKPGKFERGDKGTVFLDEIGDMPMNLQTKLLRVLEERRIERLGGVEEIPVDIRLLAATNREIPALIKEGKFRPELHYRLNVIPIDLSPLEQRGDDLVLLILHLLARISDKNPGMAKGFKWKLIEGLGKIHFSGHVRELENILTRILFESNHAEKIDQILKDVTGGKPGNILNRTSNQDIIPIWKVEKLTIEQALIKLNGNITKTAKVLEISRTSLYRKLKEYNLES